MGIHIGKGTPGTYGVPYPRETFALAGRGMVCVSLAKRVDACYLFRCVRLECRKWMGWHGKIFSRAASDDVSHGGRRLRKKWRR